MGARDAGSAVLADWVDNAQSFVTVFVWVYTLLIFVYVLLSWIRLPEGLGPVVRFLHDVCDPYLRLFRRVIPPLGPVDVSPIVAIFALVLVRIVVNKVLGQLH